MEKSIFTSKKRITHIKNSSNIPYEPDTTDEFSFDLVDSIISESMGSNLISPIKKQLDKKKTVPLNQLLSKELQVSSNEPSQALQIAEAKFKKFSVTRKFPLMEKSQKVLKQLKHNRCMPKPRAHLHSTEVSPQKDNVCAPLKASEKKVKKSLKTREKDKNSPRLCHDKQQNIPNKRAETNSSVLKNCKSSQTLKKLSETQTEEKCYLTDKSTDDSTDSEFEKFIKKNRPKIKKKSKKEHKTEWSLKHRSVKFKKVTECSVSTNSFINNNLRCSKFNQHNDRIKHNKNENVLANDNSSDDDASNPTTVNLPVNKKIGSTPEVIDISNDLEIIHSNQNPSDFQEKFCSALSPDSYTNQNLDLEKVSCLKGVSSNLSIKDTNMFINPSSVSYADGVNKAKSLISLQKNQTADIEKNSLDVYESPPQNFITHADNSHNSSFMDGKLDLNQNIKCIKKDFIPYDEFCASESNNVVKNLNNSDSDVSDIEIITIVNKATKPLDILETNCIPTSNESSELDVDQTKNICSDEVKQSIVNINSSKSFRCKSESSTSEDNEAQKTINAAKGISDKHVIKQEVAEKHDPVYKTNICLDVTHDEKPGECPKFTCVSSDSSSVKLFKANMLGDNPIKPFNDKLFEAVDIESDDDIIEIDPNCETLGIKQKDNDIIIEFEGKVPMKDSLFINPSTNSNSKRKNYVLGDDARNISSYPLASKISKINSLQSKPTSSQKELPLFSSSSNNDQIQDKNVIVEKPVSFEELLACYRKEFNVYQEILKTEANVETTFRMVETHQAKKLKKIRALIFQEHGKLDPCLNQISNDSVLYMDQEPAFTQSETNNVTTPRSSIHETSNVVQSGNLSGSKSETMTNTRITASNFATEFIKVENEHASIGQSMHSLHCCAPDAAVSKSNLICKSEVDMPPSGEQDMDFLGQICAACGKNAKFACQRCAKVFFCSNLCGKHFWIKCHKDVCGK